MAVGFWLSIKQRINYKSICKPIKPCSKMNPVIFRHSLSLDLLLVTPLDNWQEFQLMFLIFMQSLGLVVSLNVWTLPASLPITSTLSSFRSSLKTLSLSLTLPFRLLSADLTDFSYLIWWL